MNARLRLAYVGMHPARRAELVERMGSPGSVLSAIEQGSVQVPEHARRAGRVPARDRIEQLAGAGIGVVMREDLPDFLSELPDCPDLLFTRGTLPDRPGVAIVGSRKATAYGTRLSAAYGRALSDWPIISGLARGVDGAAHRGMLESGGRGVAVLGCGPDVWYPKEHRRLGEQLIAGGGAVVSEYPPGTPPNGWRFPPRNRIISGLARIVVVVEAARTGGALITARTALAQGRDVFAVPGDIDRPTSEGCNLLIRDGAFPVLDPADLVESVSIVLGPVAARPVPFEPDGLLRFVGPVGVTVDALAEELDRPVTAVLAEVSRLEARGLIQRRGGLICRGR